MIYFIWVVGAMFTYGYTNCPEDWSKGFDEGMGGIIGNLFFWPIFLGDAIAKK